MDRRLRIYLGGAVLVILLAVLDMVADGEAFDLAGFAFEVFDRTIMVGTVALVVLGVFELRKLRGENAELREDIARAVVQGTAWRARSRETLADLGQAIQSQFDAWSLTRAEADIAGLMLKGVSLRDIAQVRRTSETTIRQQAQAVYRKSGLSGRAELAAYFLESLFDDGRARAAGEPS